MILFSIALRGREGGHCKNLRNIALFPTVLSKVVVKLLTRILFGKVASQGSILVQLSFKIFVCMMENLGVRTIQILHTHIS